MQSPPSRRTSAPDCTVCNMFKSLSPHLTASNCLSYNLVSVSRSASADKNINQLDSCLSFYHFRAKKGIFSISIFSGNKQFAKYYSCFFKPVQHVLLSMFGGVWSVCHQKKCKWSLIGQAIRDIVEEVIEGDELDEGSISTAGKRDEQQS